MSYRITMDGQPFCSSNVEHSAVLDPKVTLEVNKSGSLSFTMMPDHPYYDEIEFRQNIFDVYLNDELIFEGIPVSEATDFWNRKTVVCEGELTFLNDTIQRQAVYRNQSVQSLLGEYLTVHNNQADLTKQFSTGIVTVTGGNSIFRYTNFQTTMKELQEDLIQNFGGYFRVRHSGGVRYLDYLDSSPHSSSQTIRIGKNLVDLSQNLSSLDICTVLIPLGAKTGNQLIDGLDERLTIKSVNSNKDYLVGTAQAYYGNIWATQTWDDVTTASALKSKGQEFLDDVQWSNLVISATAFDLGLATEDVEQFHVLDMIRVISEPHGIDRYFLLSKLDIDLDHPANTKIQLGEDKRLSLSARSAKLSDDIERQATSIQVSASENARMILDNATDGAIQILYNQDGVAYELRINNSQNPDTATKWWRYNSGGWGFTADGGQTYTAAATNDGTIFATLIKAGILSSDNGKYWLNMANGEVKMESGQVGGWTINTTSLSKTLNTTDTLAYSEASALTTALTQVLLGTAFPTGDEYLNYDLNGDGQLNSTDTAILTNMSSNSRNLTRGHSFSVAIDASTGEVSLTEDYSAALQGTGSTFSGTRKTKIMSGAIDTGAVCGKDAYFSNQMSANKVIYSTLQQSSDRTIKKKVKTIGKKLVNALKELNPVSFVYKHDTEQKERYGLIAQEVEQTALQGLVSDNGGLKGLNYMDLIPILIAGWQNHEERITNLEEDK